MHDFCLQPKQLIIWIITLDKVEVSPDWFSVLSLDERKRTHSYSFKKDQDRFIRSRLALRLLLSKCLMILPKEIIFEYDRFGKPYLAKNYYLKEIKFNLSHTDEMLVIGITPDCAIGIDIESITQIKYHLTIEFVIKLV